MHSGGLPLPLSLQCLITHMQIHTLKLPSHFASFGPGRVFCLSNRGVSSNCFKIQVPPISVLLRGVMGFTSAMRCCSAFSLQLPGWAGRGKEPRSGFGIFLWGYKAGRGLPSACAAALLFLLWESLYL